MINKPQFQTKRGGLWWKDLSILSQDTSGLGPAMAVCCVKERQGRFGTQRYRTKSLMAALTSRGPSSSVLVHRMLLSELFLNEDMTELDATRILALEALPWNKVRYYNFLRTIGTVHFNLWLTILSHRIFSLDPD